jgi:hypothetical protein
MDDDDREWEREREYEIANPDQKTRHNNEV